MNIKAPTTMSFIFTANSGGLPEAQMEDLRTLLECPVCTESSGRSMFLCVNGHIICEVCRKQLQQCPLCQGHISSIRSLLHKQISDLLFVTSKCGNANQGCSKQVLLHNTSSHAKECNFRDFKCQFNTGRKSCKSVVVKYRNFLRHLVNVHNYPVTKNATVSFRQLYDNEGSLLGNDKYMYGWSIRMMECYNQTFLTGTSIINGNIMWWLFVFGDQQTADGFSSTIIVKNESAGLATTWTGPVHHIRMGANVITERGLCLTLNKERFRLFTYSKHEVVNGNLLLQSPGCDLTFIVQKKEQS